MAGCDVVYHLAAKVGTWGDRREFDRVNVDGVRSALDAARAAGVPRFIHASTPSVVGYSRDVENGGRRPAVRIPVRQRVYADLKAKPASGWCLPRTVPASRPSLSGRISSSAPATC